MELKVYVDGIQRVVCGVSDDTTCHDVIIALANAMGRTGRFTLIEKWRDIERPLPQNEYPARSLQKWGEYASEVKLHLCQSDSVRLKSPRETNNVDKFSHTFSPPEQHQPSEPTIKRSSTFSGAHNLDSASKSHRDQLASRLQPISENRHSVAFHPLPHSSSTSPNYLRPVPSPRRKVSPNRTVSPLRLPSPRNVLNHSPAYITVPHNIVRPLPNRPAQQHNTRSHNSSPSNFHIYSNHEHIDRHPLERTVPQKMDVRNNYRCDNNTPNSPRDELLAVEHTFGSRSNNHSRSASLEIEEYDLDCNFPDVLRDSSRTERPSVHTEYKLEGSEVNSGNQPESEHARLVRLVTVQLERIKTQESQIDMVDTEISSMEEQEKEYEEELEKITKEFLNLEEKENQVQPDIIHLESVSWEIELTKSQQLEKEVKLHISQLNTKQRNCEKQISESKRKESELNQTILKLKDQIAISEKRLQEDEKGLKLNVEKLKFDLSTKQSECDEIERELENVNKEIKTSEKLFVDREKEVVQIEEELKDENIKLLEEPASVKNTLKTENGEAILKILEGRLSPRPTSSQLKNPQAFINSLSTKNPNGVWV